MFAHFFSYRMVTQFLCWANGTKLEANALNLQKSSHIVFGCDSRWTALKVLYTFLKFFGVLGFSIHINDMDQLRNKLDPVTMAILEDNCR